MRKTLTITCGLLAVTLMLALASPADAAMIDIVAAGVNSTFNTAETGAADAINGVGLTGATHDTNYKSGWLSPNNAAAVDGSIFVIDLKANYTLDVGW